jgi:phosphoribosylanthranilate isomerase
VPVEIKYCGLTRREDVEMAVELGASFVGVIFAGGPRLVSADRAAILFDGLPTTVRRVGVFGDQTTEEIATIATQASLDVVQLHGASAPNRARALRTTFGGEVWPVVRVGRDFLPADFSEAFEAGDAVLFDALVPGKLGGTGVTMPWDELATALAAQRPGRRVVVAGGLHAQNVAAAIKNLSPDIVDVSSGVESAPGIKDHGRMRAFRDAVLGVSGDP